MSGFDPSTEVVPYIPALVAPRHVPYFNIPCHVHGAVRVLSQSVFGAAGFAPERYEELRQAGAVWFLDATDDDSSCKPLADGVAGEVWGFNPVRASYDVHMDAELGISYAGSRALFDAACNSVLHGLKDLCAARSVELFNLLDLDFTYTNATKAFTVLRSREAESIQDPMLVAIRDWHRRRSEG